MSQIYSIYNQFVSNFPPVYQGWISIILVILIFIGVYKIIKREFVWLIVLIILLPASVPILKNVWESIITFIQFLLAK